MVKPNVNRLALLPQGGAATGPLAHEIEGAIGPVHLHLINDSQEFPQATLRPADLIKITQVLGRQIKDRDPVGMVGGPVSPERHPGLLNLGQLGLHFG